MADVHATEIEVRPAADNPMGSADLSLQTIFAITRALGLDFMVAITTPEPTGEAVKTRPTGNTTKEKKTCRKSAQAAGKGT
jgi:hypothetical protein